MLEITSSKLKLNDRPTNEQLKRIERAAKKPIIHSKDSPEYTSEQLAHLYSESKKLNIKKT